MTKAFLPNYKHSWRQDALAAALLLALLYIARSLAFAKFNTHYIGGSTHDAGLYIWLMEHNWRDLWQLPWFDTKAFYPYGSALAWSDNFILPSLAAIPMIAVGISKLAAYNTVLLLTQLLNGFLSYKLSSRLGAEKLSSIFAGGCVMLLGVLTWNMGHPQLQFLFFIPLIVLSYFRFLEKRDFLSGFLCGLCIFLSFITTVYYSIFCTLTLLFFAASTFIQRPGEIKLKEWTHFGLGLALGTLLTIPFALPYLPVRETFGARRLYEPYYFSANFLSFLSASPRNRLYSAWSDLSHAEAHLFGGFTLLALTVSSFIRTFKVPKLRWHLSFFVAVFAGMLVFSTPGYRDPLVCIMFQWLSLLSFIVLLWKLGILERTHGAKFFTNRAVSASLLFAALVFLILSFGPIGNPEKGEVSFSVYRLFFETFPGFNSVRAVGRLGIAALVFAVLASSLEVSRIFSKFKKCGVLCCSGLFLLILIENWTPHYPLEQMERKPSVFHYLEENAALNEAAAVVPLTTELKHGSLVKNWGDFAKQNVSAMLLGFQSEINFVNGYSGLRTKIMKDWPRKMDGFLDNRSLTALSTVANLRWIIYNSAANEDFDKELFLRKAAYYKDSITFKFSDEDGYYLFDLHHPNDLKEPFFVLTPNLDGALSFQFKSAGSSLNTESVVDIYTEDLEGKAHIGFAAVLQNGEWQEVALPIKSNGHPVKPLKFTFEIRDGGQSVYLRNAKFVPRR